MELSFNLDNYYMLQNISSSQEQFQADADNPFKELNEEIRRSRRINPTEQEISDDEFSGLDDKVCTTKKLVSNADDIENNNNVVEENLQLWKKYRSSPSIFLKSS